MEKRDNEKGSWGSWLDLPSDHPMIFTIALAVLGIGLAFLYDFVARALPASWARHLERVMAVSFPAVTLAVTLASSNFLYAALDDIEESILDAHENPAGAMSRLAARRAATGRQPPKLGERR